ncbi:lectin-like protein [uncultured Draconibacterium sp.]|uniref:Ig-like domain-containing protein n=1 Tax=uncultured Draconibacterium sp. TaxID=1573823 RepID=UPI0029C69869|nr:lectin-like protein [uncultured Draconibacterium sp.]
MKRTLLATFQKCTIRNFSLKAISSDQHVSVTKSLAITLKSLLLLTVLLCANLGARTQSLSTNDPGNLVANSSNTPVNIGSTVSITTGPTSLTAATVSIAGNFHQGADSLEINNTTSGDYGSFTFSYNSSSGVLTLSGPGTEAQYQDALSQVTFRTNSTSNSARTITFSLNAALPFSGNGHYYEHITATDILWTTARDQAAAKSYFGRKGYLVTVTSQEENDFVAEKLGGAQGWMGANDATNEGAWRWVTGPEGNEDSGAGRLFWNGSAVGYTNWNVGEPNDSEGNEDYGQFVTSGAWNDLSETHVLDDYVVEYGDTPGDMPTQISDNITIEIVTNPTAITGTTTICAGETTELTAQNAQGTVYWYTDGCGTTELGTGNPISVSPLTTTTYYARNNVTGQFSEGCASVTVTVNLLDVYRSAQTGSWTDAANWEQYNGTSWVAATSYPGEISNSCGSPMVIIQATDTLTIPPSATISTPNLTIEADGIVEKDPSASLTISQQLIMDEDADGAIKITSTVD